MPLSFQSLSHGTIAFGFFNIESDMLLLDRYFFFATEFCELVSALAASEQDQDEKALQWRVKRIESADDIGDLMGAIHGVHFSGFIGEVYRRYPFPEQQEDFKQNPNGNFTQEEMSAIIQPYAEDNPIKVSVNEDGSEIAIGNYHFDRPEFHRLLDYVWLGGYPRWKDDERPVYVVDMYQRIRTTAVGLFNDVQFSQ